jgi:hypothetical protein
MKIVLSPRWGSPDFESHPQLTRGLYSCVASRLLDLRSLRLRSNVRGPRSDARGLRSEVRSPKSEVRGSTYEVRLQLQCF